MGNSSLVNYTRLSPNNSGKRTMSIDRITPHCVVGQLSVETMGSMFAKSSYQASCNYAIGSDGRVGLIVDESKRSWCSSSNANDQRAVTIECASDKTHPYAINNKVYNKLIDLCVDICRRNGKNVLLWFGDKTKTLNYTPKSNEMVITVHRWFANKACPGDYIYSRLGAIAAEVTKRLGGTIEEIKYKVRLTWDNASSQKGAFVYYEKAMECANANPGYTVFDLTGKALYTSKGLPSVDTIIAGQNKKASLALLATLPDYKGLPESQSDYINKVSEIAMKLYPYTRVLPSVVISQAFLENGGGTASDAIELTKRSNLIGQKSDLINSTWQDYTVWDGTSFSKRTPEVYNGVPTTITAAFRVFPNYAYSILDYEMFLTHVKSGGKYKYRDVVGMTDPEKMISIISSRGYATGTTYKSSVMRIINQYDLTKYDKQVIAALTSSEVSTTPSDAHKATQEASSVAPTQPSTSTATTSGKTYYRAQVGVFSTVAKRDALIKKIKNKLGYDCFYEKNGNNYYVYCGSYANKATAQARVRELQSKGFAAFVKAVKV